MKYEIPEPGEPMDTVHHEPSLSLSSGSLTLSQFPVFTLYVQKNCLIGAPVCERAWSFERVMGFELDGYAKKNTVVRNRQQCQVACMQEEDFPCRSVTKVVTLF